MKHLAMLVAVGALACFATAGTSRAAPMPGAVGKLAPMAQSSGIVDQVHWRRHHHRWWGYRHHRRWWW